jgi:8-oxo-dGTP diphosphatase
MRVFYIEDFPAKAIARQLPMSENGCTQYVLGFAFDCTEGEHSPETNVALIRKINPAWQAGSLNGIGGHIEDFDENPHDAMVREFQEETGTLVDVWHRFCIMGTDQWNVYVYAAYNVPLHELKTTTKEEVTIVNAYSLPTDVLFNLRWLVPLGLDPQPFPIQVPYR